MTPFEAASVYETRVLGEIAFALILAGLVIGYVYWEWKASAEFRQRRKVK